MTLCCKCNGDAYKPAQSKQAYISRIFKCALLSVGKQRRRERDNTGQFALIITRLFPGRYETGDRSLVEWPARKGSASPGLSWVVKHLHEGTAVVLTSLCESPS